MNPFNMKSGLNIKEHPELEEKFDDISFISLDNGEGGSRLLTGTIKTITGEQLFEEQEVGDLPLFDVALLVATTLRVRAKKRNGNVVSAEIALPKGARNRADRRKK